MAGLLISAASLGLGCTGDVEPEEESSEDVGQAEQALSSLLQWSSVGPIPGQVCVKIHESADPHSWMDNYLCSGMDLGLAWSSAGPIAGMRCTQVNEPADPYTWNDNYLCVHAASNLYFSWSYAGPIAGKTCVQISEPLDPHTWTDNYLCYSKESNEPVLYEPSPAKYWVGKLTARPANVATRYDCVASPVRRDVVITSAECFVNGSSPSKGQYGKFKPTSIGDSPPSFTVTQYATVSGGNGTVALAQVQDTCAWLGSVTLANVSTVTPSTGENVDYFTLEHLWEPAKQVVRRAAWDTSQGNLQRHHVAAGGLSWKQHCADDYFGEPYCRMDHGALGFLQGTSKPFAVVTGFYQTSDGVRYPRLAYPTADTQLKTAIEAKLASWPKLCP